MMKRLLAKNMTWSKPPADSGVLTIPSGIPEYECDFESDELPESKQVYVVSCVISDFVNDPDNQGCYKMTFNMKQQTVIILPKEICASAQTFFQYTTTLLEAKYYQKTLIVSSVEGEDIFIRTDNHIQYLYTKINENTRIFVIGCNQTTVKRLQGVKQKRALVGKEVLDFFASTDHPNSETSIKGCSLEDQIKNAQNTTTRNIMHIMKHPAEEQQTLQQVQPNDKFPGIVFIPVYPQFMEVLQYLNSALHCRLCEKKAKGEDITFNSSKVRTCAVM